MRSWSRAAPLLCIIGSALPASCRSGVAPSASITTSPKIVVNYCDKLQPLLDAEVQKAGVGAQLTCLSFPGITELGRFGIRGDKTNGELGHVRDCFDDPTQFEKLTSAESNAFSLVITESFGTGVSVGATGQLRTLVPWLPELSVRGHSRYSLEASISLEDAKFVTLERVATELQSQKREPECASVLCEPQVTYVHKALVAKTVAVVTAKNEQGQAIDADAIVVDTNFARSNASKTSVSLASTRPITVAVSRVPFRTLATKRTCSRCGRAGWKCCENPFSCDGGLACREGQCVEAGGEHQPCDDGACHSSDLQCLAGVCRAVGRPGQACRNDGTCAGGVCVKSLCESKCGNRDQPCCGADGCALGLACERSLARITKVLSVGASLFGVSEDRVIGGPCDVGYERVRAETRSLQGGGYCQKSWWFDDGNPHDCRIAVHVALPSLTSVDCEVTAVVKPVAGTCSDL